MEHRQEARRFITLIDAIYESKCSLICSAETEPSNLFLHLEEVEGSSAAEEEVFAFQRAVSRLVEIQGVDWLEPKTKQVIMEIAVHEADKVLLITR